MLALRDQFPADTTIVTYEAMLADPAAVAAQLFRFLDVSDSPEIVGNCVARTSFAALAVAQSAAPRPFFRKGVAGDWRNHLSPEVNGLVLRELGWMFPLFGWPIQ
jgi:hypothetical protein